VHDVTVLKQIETPIFILVLFKEQEELPDIQ